jgi:hypothetical protein
MQGGETSMPASITMLENLVLVQGRESGIGLGGVAGKFCTKIAAWENTKIYFIANDLRDTD